jgi:hypothetical protein
MTFTHTDHGDQQASYMLFRPVCPVVICPGPDLPVKPTRFAPLLFALALGLRFGLGLGLRFRVRVRGKLGWFARMQKSDLGQIVRRANRVAGKLTLSRYFMWVGTGIKARPM